MFLICSFQHEKGFCCTSRVASVRALSVSKRCSRMEPHLSSPDGLLCKNHSKPIHTLIGNNIASRHSHWLSGTPSQRCRFCCTSECASVRERERLRLQSASVRASLRSKNRTDLAPHDKAELLPAFSFACNLEYCRRDHFCCISNVASVRATSYLLQPFWGPQCQQFRKCGVDDSPRWLANRDMRKYIREHRYWRRIIA